MSEEIAAPKGLAFKLAREGGAVIRQDGARVPIDPDNRDYLQYLAWRGAGNEPEAADPLPPPSSAPSLVDRVAALEAKDAQRAAKIAALEAEVAATRGGREPIGGEV
jgi:hypothetical protein